MRPGPLLALAFLLPSLGPATEAQGTEPIGSGSYAVLEWDAYFEHPGRVVFMGKVYRLISESDPDADYISVAHYMKQLDSQAGYDLPMLTIYMGQEHRTRPTELDWAPGFVSPGDGPVTYSVDFGTSGVGFGISWTQQWGGDWDIIGRGDASPGNSPWTWSFHTDQFDSDDDTDDWNTISHANVWRVEQGVSWSVYLEAGIATCSGGFDCYWYWPWVGSGTTQFYVWQAECQPTGGVFGILKDLTCATAPAQVPTPPEPAASALPGKDELTHSHPLKDLDIKDP